MRKIILPLLALILLQPRNSAAMGIQRQAADSMVAAAKSAPKINVSDELAMEIYSQIPSAQKEGFSKLERKAPDVDCFCQKRYLEDLESGAEIYYRETISIMVLNGGGYFVAFQKGEDYCPKTTMLFNYKNGKLTPSQMRLPEKNIDDFVYDYLFFLGAENEIADGSQYRKMSFCGDTLSYYLENDEYIFDHYYAFQTLRFVWNGSGYTEISPSYTTGMADFVSMEGLKTSYYNGGFALCDNPPASIKGYTIKHENGEQVYYMNGQKRFSVKLFPDNEDKKQITVYTSDYTPMIGLNRAQFESSNFHSSLKFGERGGRPVATVTEFDNTIDYIFDKEGGVIVMIVITGGPVG